LTAGASKVTEQGKQNDNIPYAVVSQTQALDAFLTNTNTIAAAVEDYDMAYDPKDEKALREYLADEWKKAWRLHRAYRK
jgi:hypothetical protein